MQIQLYKQYSTLAIGVHCNLTCGNPLSNNNKLIDESTGCFLVEADITKRIWILIAKQFITN